MLDPLTELILSYVMRIYDASRVSRHCNQLCDGLSIAVGTRANMIYQLTAGAVPAERTERTERGLDEV